MLHRGRTVIPIRTWREPIDGELFAAVAFAEITYYGGYHAASFFLIVEKKNYRWRGDAEVYFEQQLTQHHDGLLPYVCAAVDRE
jgi:hypothetical protein